MSSIFKKVMVMLIVTLAYSNKTLSLTIGTKDEARSVALQTDGKIVAAGYTVIDDAREFIGARYTPAGILDITFGAAANGTVTTLIGSSCQANGVVINSTSGSIIAAGYAIVSGSTVFALAQYTSGGILDATFGTAGIVTTAIGSGATINAVALDASNNIVVAGSATVSGNPNFALARYTSGGTLDGTFGTGGIVTTAIGFQSGAYALVIQSDGNIVAAGTADGMIALARYTTTGMLDATFGTGGIVTTPISGTDVAYGVALQTDGSIVIAGLSNNNIVIARYTTSGVLDGTFGTGGITLTQAGDFNEGRGITIQTNDQSIVAGFFDRQLVAVRYTTAGVIDTTYASQGFATIDCEQSGALAIALQGSGSTVSAGFLNNNFINSNIFCPCLKIK